jgi:hypothetical protein
VLVLAEARAPLRRLPPSCRGADLTPETTLGLEIESEIEIEIEIETTLGQAPSPSCSASVSGCACGDGIFHLRAAYCLRIT